MEHKKSLSTYIRYAFQASLIGTPTQASSVLTNLFQSTTLAQFLSIGFKTAIVVGAILAVLQLSYAGFIYMTSDIISSKQKARDIIANAITGLLLLLAVWLILNQINPQILNVDILRNITPANTGN